MTRLTARDIDTIRDTLSQYNGNLVMATGHGLLEIACHCYGLKTDYIRERMLDYSVLVIPSTAGLGVISNFTESVAAILRFVGIPAEVTNEPDVGGIAQAITDNVDGIFMADDHNFIALDLKRRKMVENSEATGMVFATALSLMTENISGKDVLIIGCGPVGHAAAEQILNLDGNITLFDINTKLCHQVKEELSEKLKNSKRAGDRISVTTNLEKAVVSHAYILDATPVGGLIDDQLLSQDIRIALPGVPPGISEQALAKLSQNAIHDKLELGVAAMAVGMLS